MGSGTHFHVSWPVLGPWPLCTNQNSEFHSWQDAEKQFEFKCKEQLKDIQITRKTMFVDINLIVLAPGPVYIVSVS